MTAFEDRTAATALRQIAKYGKSTVIKRYADPVYDTATGKYTATLTDTQNVKAIVSDFNSRINRVGLDLKSGDKQITVAASGFGKPDIGDTMTIDSITYMVVPVHEGGLEIETIFAGEIPVLYKIHGRKT